jgi:opacity protein-like surface antigen
MLNKRTLLASTALAVLASVGQAQAGFYINVSGGGNFLTGDKSGFTTDGIFTSTGFRQDSETGFVLSGAVGVHLDRWLRGLRAELESSYRRNDIGGTWFVETFFADEGGVINAHESRFSVLANVWYDVNVGQKWVPYIGGGAGWSKTRANGAFATTFGGGEFGFAFDREASGFAYQLGAGINYEIQDGVRLGAGYRYFHGPKIRNDIFLGKNNVPMGFDHDNHSVQLELSVDIN